MSTVNAPVFLVHLLIIFKKSKSLKFRLLPKK